jgi:putative endonuclease
MTGKKQLGDMGEQIAADYLVKDGWRICERGFRTREGEVDIIARKGKCLTFVEVKTRRSHLYGRPEEAEGWRKQQKIRQVALSYLAQKGNGFYDEISFGVVAITMAPDGSPSVDYIADAF